MKGKEGREGKGREGKGREGKGREGKGEEGGKVLILNSIYCVLGSL